MSDRATLTQSASLAPPFAFPWQSVCRFIGQVAMQAVFSLVDLNVRSPCWSVAPSSSAMHICTLMLVPQGKQLARIFVPWLPSGAGSQLWYILHLHVDEYISRSTVPAGGVMQNSSPSLRIDGSSWSVICLAVICYYAPCQKT